MNSNALKSAQKASENSQKTTKINKNAKQNANQKMGENSPKIPTEQKTKSPQTNAKIAQKTPQNANKNAKTPQKFTKNTQNSTQKAAKRLKIALVQMHAVPYKCEQNLQKALNLAQKACKKGVRLIVLPELFDNGYCVGDKDGEFGIDFKKATHPTFRALSEFARVQNAYIIACSIEKSGKKLYDTAFIISPKGKLVGKHRKIYLWDTEKRRFERGKKYEIFKLNFDDFSVSVGLQICYELGFGESARALALKGAELLVYPSAFGKARAYNWDLLSRVRALENGCFVLACGLSGGCFDKHFKQSVEFAGASRVVSPKGKIIREATNNDECIICELDLNEIKSQRKALPYLKDFDKKMIKRAFEGV